MLSTTQDKTQQIATASVPRRHPAEAHVAAAMATKNATTVMPVSWVWLADPTSG
jgi:hypothetical protein